MRWRGCASRGQAVFSRSILLIYMVPVIVLALPIYIGFSMTGLRNTLFGILLIYPVTTIPVALYMLQGYFRGLPAEVEEAGLMDGLNRLQVIWKITLPLALPALASVSLYVFMIAWNEFLLAFMLLDDPSKFTLTRGIASLNSSEIPAPTPDGRGRCGHGAHHGAVSGAGTFHDQGPDRRLCERMTIMDHLAFGPGSPRDPLAPRTTVAATLLPTSGPVIPTNWNWDSDLCRLGLCPIRH